ncbi:hypothetical protein D3C72_619840 [compost metagenome]
MQHLGDRQLVALPKRHAAKVHERGAIFPFKDKITTIFRTIKSIQGSVFTPQLFSLIRLLQIAVFGPGYNDRPNLLRSRVILASKPLGLFARDQRPVVNLGQGLQLALKNRLVQLIKLFVFRRQYRLNIFGSTHFQIAQQRLIGQIGDRDKRYPGSLCCRWHFGLHQRVIFKPQDQRFLVVDQQHGFRPALV